MYRLRSIYSSFTETRGISSLAYDICRVIIRRVFKLCYTNSNVIKFEWITVAKYDILYLFIMECAAFIVDL